MVDEQDWEDVQNLLTADLGGLDHEKGELYDEVERYARRADVLDDHGDEDTAEYFKELAVESYDRFVEVVQMKKDAEDYSF